MIKKCKTFLAVLCAITMIITAVPVSVNASENTSGDFTYIRLESSKEVCITGYKGSSPTVVVPETIDSLKVTTILSNAFANNQTIRAVAMRSIETIENNAFSGCTNLQLIIFGSLNWVGDNAFLNCPLLTPLDVPASLKTIGKHAFGFSSDGVNYTVNSDFVMNCGTNTTACQYAKSNGITYNGCLHQLTKVPEQKPTSNSNGNIEYYRCLLCGKIFKDSAGKQEITHAETITTYSRPTSMNDVTIQTIADQAYTGYALRPSVIVKYGNSVLTEGTDYTLDYRNNTNIGTATVYVSGRNGISGSKTITFRIVGRDISSTTIVAIPDQLYTGRALTPAITVRYGSTTLSSYSDYNVTYYNNVNIGTATATITGKGNYSGSKTITFRIIGKDINNTTISSIAAQKYTGYAVRPTVTIREGLTTLKENVDYTLYYTNNINVGTASITITGIGNYGGTKVINFTIAGKDLKNATVSTISDQTYTGKAITPKPTVTLTGTTLRENIDYTLNYYNNTNAGIATITITGKGEYSGSITKTFNIVQNSITISASNIVLNYSEKERILKLNASATNNATLSYKSNNDDVSISSKGQLTISEEFSGTATITITATAAGYQTATKQITVRIPSSVRVISTKRTTNTSALIKWGKHSKMNGYIIQYSETPKFTTNTEELTITENTTNTKTIKGLTKGQKYYVRVRTFLTNNGTKYYSNWSKRKTIISTVSNETLYRNYLNKEATKVEQILSYTTYDINGDGTKDLIYKYYNGGNRDCGAICTIVDGKVKRIFNQPGGSPHFYTLSDTPNQIVVSGSNSAFESQYDIYTISNNKKKTIHKIVVSVNQQGKTVYTIDGKKAKKSQFTKYQKQFKEIKLTKF